jgi:HEAT repeat protein
MVTRRRAADATARLRAVRALPKAAASCEALLAAVDDPSLEVAKAALERLARLGGPTEAAELRRRLLELDLGLVPACAAALRALEDHEAAGVAAWGLRDGSPTVRIAAAIALRELAAPETAGALRRALSDPIAGVRRAVAEALGALGPSVVNADACARLADDPSADVRSTVVTTLLSITNDPGKRVQGRIDDPAPRVRVALARGASRLRSSLVVGLACDDDADVREQTAWTLAAHPRRQLVPLLMTLATDDPSWHVRRAACRALGSAGDVRARPALVRALTDVHELVRGAGIRALIEIFGTGLADALCEELSAPDSDLRRAVVYACVEARLPRAGPRIGRLAADPEPAVRMAVTHALAALRPPGWAETLETLTGDAEVDVRHAAIHVLEQARLSDG